MYNGGIIRALFMLNSWNMKVSKIVEGRFAKRQAMATRKVLD